MTISSANHVYQFIPIEVLRKTKATSHFRKTSIVRLSYTGPTDTVLADILGLTHARVIHTGPLQSCHCRQLQSGPLASHCSFVLLQTALFRSLTLSYRNTSISAHLASLARTGYVIDPVFLTLNASLVLGTILCKSVGEPKQAARSQRLSRVDYACTHLPLVTQVGAS